MAVDSNSVQSRSFLGALAAAIKAFCMLLIDSVGVANEGVAMLDASVKIAREKQAITLAIDMSDFAVISITKASVEQAKVQESLREYVAKDGSGERAKLVDESQKKLKQLVDQELSRIRAERTAG